MLRALGPERYARGATGAPQRPPAGKTLGNGPFAVNQSCRGLAQPLPHATVPGGPIKTLGMGLNFVRRGALTIFGLGIAVALAACSSAQEDGPMGASVTGIQTAYDSKSGRQVDADGDFGGVVLADEPRAAQIGRDILERGGTAADAAAATYFALSVTYPVAASLGSGGVCLAFNHETGEVDSIEFPVGRAKAGGAVGVPGSVRGMALLHARHGDLRWGELIAPAERLAATGFQVSRALAVRVGDAADRVNADPQLAAAYTVANGRFDGEFRAVEQIDLAVTLGLIRARGAAHLYRAQGARGFAAAAQAAGGSITPADLLANRPTVSQTSGSALGDHRIHLPATVTPAGRFGAALWQALESEPSGQLSAARVRSLAQAASGGAEPGADFGSTAFLAIDDDANAVACAATMNGPFGAGRVAPGTGIVLAAPPGAGGEFLAPVLAVNPYTNEVFYAAAGAGGPEGPGAAMQLALATLGAGQDLTAAYLSSASTRLSPVNAFACAEGLSPNGGSCALGVDPNGFGLGLEALAP